MPAFRAPVACVLVLAAAATTALAQQRPVFRSGADIVAVDVQVVTNDGLPLAGLKPEQFEVFIDGYRRAVQSVEFLRAATPIPLGKAGANAPPPPSGPNDPGRVFMLGIDQMSFPASAQWSAKEAARRVVARLSPNDYIGMMSFPGDVRIAPTRDRVAIEEGIKQISGLRQDVHTLFSISIAEASAIRANDPMTSPEVFNRECMNRLTTDPGNRQQCRDALRQDSNAIVVTLEQQATTSINGLNDVVDSMASLAGRKTLVVISAGVPLSNRLSGRPDFNHELARLARRSAVANVNLYVFYMNIHFLRFYSAEYRKHNYTIFDDIAMFGYGLEKFADGAGGSFAQVEVDADPFVDRLMRETSAYYLLAVPVEPGDRDGKEHAIRVGVKAAGATVRFRKAVVIPAAGK
jgi:VWFA-related protein